MRRTVALKTYTYAAEDPLVLEKTEAHSPIGVLSRIVSHQLVRPENHFILI